MTFFFDENNQSLVLMVESRNLIKCLHHNKSERQKTTKRKHQGEDDTFRECPSCGHLSRPQTVGGEILDGLKESFQWMIG